VIFEVTRNPDLIPDEWNLKLPTNNGALQIQTMMVCFAVGCICLFVKCRKRSMMRSTKADKFEDFP